MQDKHALFTEVFLSRAAVWLSRRSAVEPYDSRQHCCIWFMKTWRKRKQPASLWRSVVSRVFVHWGSGYHLVLSCLLSEWESESASTGGGLEDTPLLSRSPLALFPAHMRTPLVQEENWWLWPELLWSSAATGGLLTLTGQTPHQRCRLGPRLLPSKIESAAQGMGRGERWKRDQVLLVCRLAVLVRLSPCLTDEETVPCWFSERLNWEHFNKAFPQAYPTLSMEGQKGKGWDLLLPKASDSYLGNFPSWIWWVLSFFYFPSLFQLSLSNKARPTFIPWKMGKSGQLIARLCGCNSCLVIR